MTDLRPIFPADAALALPALRELRPDAPASPQALAAHLRTVEVEGYRLVGGFEAGRTEARRLGCRGLRSDSGVGERRWAAHRLYLTAALNSSGHHFEKELS